MKVIAQIPKENCHVTLFSWNGKYIVKIEQGLLEQTYKINAMDITGESEVYNLIENEAFMQSVRTRFDAMNESLQMAMDIF
ncbi:hypothetical protein QNI16_01175 [Cytophagaceae bacterium YF14B1]|uniref:Uncharacterized protein n=1 Tax=Xanthocytophaga flava TaxID=3048013 RepID=A0AAE3U515_9BACT|nr:hypothetical protein [Xanthocytophaga flavus]MDJ1479072.1 hypothetical protein [Xanthocytophaga flavus]